VNSTLRQDVDPPKLTFIAVGSPAGAYLSSKYHSKENYTHNSERENT